MRVLACGVVFNEIDILPYLLDYYKSQDIELFIFDNFSTDGTWEFLQDNKIPSVRLNSDGKFSLVYFIKKMTEIWHRSKPDWCIYSDADEFPLSFQFPSLKTLIEDRYSWGFNVISQPRVNFRPTGYENFSLGDPRRIYRYYFIDWPDGIGHVYCDRIFKYSKDIDFLWSGGHQVKRFNKRTSCEPLDNPIFHYSMRKNAKEKILQLHARRTLDEETIALGWNTHYKRFIQKDQWIWDRDQLYDIENPTDKLYNIINSSTTPTTTTPTTPSTSRKLS